MYFGKNRRKMTSHPHHMSPCVHDDFLFFFIQLLGTKGMGFLWSPKKIISFIFCRIIHIHLLTYIIFDLNTFKNVDFCLFK